MARRRSSKARIQPAAVSLKHLVGTADRYDVIVVGAGPAGSTLAWKLACEGVNTIVLDGASFPREKVCGDYVEPRGLRLLDKMGCLPTLEARSPLPIMYTSIYVDFKKCFIGKIPFYGVNKDLPAHGYVVPRKVLDEVMLKTAIAAGATAHQETYVTDFRNTRNGVAIEALHHGKRVVYQGRMVVGADGVNSVVARRAGVLVDDPRHIAISQRAYADGYEGGIGEATMFFDGDLFPGYGWVFPMGRGQVNLGVGVLKEACERDHIVIPQLFRNFFEKLKQFHPRCGKLQLCRPPIGGIVKTYGGAGPNYFENGLLVGDAGSFVDPMTGEGITLAMESALIAAGAVLDVLQKRQIHAKSFSTYEAEYRKYFDPSMICVDFCAATMRNRHYWRSWRKALVRGCELAQGDSKFAVTVGACFGGLEINPPGILAELWMRTAENLLSIGSQSVLELLEGGANGTRFTLQETAGWITDSWESLWDDPFWHARWATDVQRKWVRTLAVVNKRLPDPRTKGVIEWARRG